MGAAEDVVEDAVMRVHYKRFGSGETVCGYKAKGNYSWLIERVTCKVCLKRLQSLEKKPSTLCGHPYITDHPLIPSPKKGKP